MTKREICERLMSIHNRLLHEYAMADGMEDIDLEAIGKDIGSLILDLAAPVEEQKEPKSVEVEGMFPGFYCDNCHMCGGISDRDPGDPPTCSLCGVKMKPTLFKEHPVAKREEKAEEEGK